MVWECSLPRGGLELGLKAPSIEGLRGNFGKRVYQRLYPYGSSISRGGIEVGWEKKNSKSIQTDRKASNPVAVVLDDDQRSPVYGILAFQ